MADLLKIRLQGGPKLIAALKSSSLAEMAPEIREELQRALDAELSED
jgi:hypothetical protein